MVIVFGEAGEIVGVVSVGHGHGHGRDYDRDHDHDHCIPPKHPRLPLKSLTFGSFDGSSAGGIHRIPVDPLDQAVLIRRGNTLRTHVIQSVAECRWNP